MASRLSFRFIFLAVLCLQSFPIMAREGHAISGALGRASPGRYRERVDDNSVYAKMIPFRGRWVLDRAESNSLDCPAEIVVFPTLSRVQPPVTKLEVKSWDTERNVAGKEWGRYSATSCSTHIDLFSTDWIGDHGLSWGSLFYADGKDVPTRIVKTIKKCSIYNFSYYDGDTWTQLAHVEERYDKRINTYLLNRYHDAPPIKEEKRFSLIDRRVLSVKVNNSQTKLVAQNSHGDVIFLCHFMKRTTGF